MKRFIALAFFAIICISITSQTFAKDVSLVWDRNSEENVIGYKVYYQAGSASLPFGGQDAAEGPSPIDVGNNLTATLSGLKDGEIYYFAVTAYNAAGESPYSSHVASDWIPELFYPQISDSVRPDEVVFSWSSAPEDTQVSYSLIFGTDPQLSDGGLAYHSSAQNTALASLSLLGLLGAALLRRRKTAALMCLGIALMLSGCGGGGGGSPEVVIDPNDDGGSGVPAQIVSGLVDNSYTEYQLQPDTRYYWKVVATDAQGTQRESAIGSFVTGQY